MSEPLDPVSVFTFASPHPQAALKAVEDLLDRSGGELAGLRLRPTGQLVETTLRVAGLADRAADALGERLASRAGVSALRVEHVRPLA